MSQSDSFTTVPTSLDGLEEAAKEILEEEAVSDQAHRLIREIQRAQIIARAKRYYRETGEKSNKRLRKQFSDEFNISEAHIKTIIYENV